MQQHDVFVAHIFLDMPKQVADRHAPAFYRLQKYSPAITQDSGNATDRVGLARLRQNGIDRFRAGIHGAARI